ncbi:MAG: hypothetical protein ACRCYU_18595 [Nocardioides sp.]
MSMRKRPGPKPKGLRRQFTMRLPEDQFAVYKAEAERRKLSLADYLTESLARGHGLPEPAYLHRDRPNDHQQELPLTGTG